MADEKWKKAEVRAQVVYGGDRCHVTLSDACPTSSEYLPNDVMKEKWLMKMAVEMAAQFNIPNDVRRNPTIVWRESKKR